MTNHVDVRNITNLDSSFEYMYRNGSISFMLQYLTTSFLTSLHFIQHLERPVVQLLRRNLNPPHPPRPFIVHRFSNTLFSG